jgi:VWFA-related protein
MAEEYLARASRDRKALLVVTDGNDNASMIEAEEVERRAQQRDIVVYAIGLLADEEAGRAKHARHDLERLTEATGGAAYFPATIADVDAVALDIARQIRSQYTIAYAPLNQSLDGSYRRIAVEAKGPERLSVRTRAGYRATPDVLGIPTR